MGSKYDLDDLLYLMERLRDPQSGCPWDIEQNFDSIVPHTLEEAHEVADAIERNAFDELPGELGDLLFQVVYYCQMAREQKLFDMGDVLDTCVRKLIRRHPHVFPAGDLHGRREDNEIDAQQVEQQWQQIKAQEHDPRKKPLSRLDSVPLSMPALTRAAKLQKKAAAVGFDWPETGAVLDKLHEETLELEQALATAERDAIEHELGDMLFTLVNLARFLELDPEQALRRANQRFSQRFGYMEQRLESLGKDISRCGLAELDSLWNEAKQQLGKKED